MIQKIQIARIESTKKCRSFLVYLFVLVLALVTTISIFNYLVNPYRLYFKNAPSALTDKKPRPEQLQQEIRTELALRSNADVFVFGNSMMEIGINPESASLAGNGISVFNMGIAGFTLGASANGLLDILDRRVPKYAIVAASFSDYLMQGPTTSTTEVASKKGSIVDKARLIVLSAFSGETTMDSFKTLTINRRSYPQTITGYGHNPMLDYLGHASRSGYRVIFDTANIRIHEALQKHRAVRYNPTTGPAKSMEELRLLVKILQSRGTKVTIVINPLHIDYSASVQQFGLQRTFEDWKRELANMSDAIKVPVVDFGCEGSSLAEIIPAINDKKTVMAGYWDAQHFKPYLGDQMITTILESNGTNYSRGQLVGTLIHSRSIDEHNARCASFFNAHKNTLKTN